MEFERLRDSLISANKAFDAESLRELSYVNLVRAGIGDAGAAGCSLALVRAERARRVAEMAEQIQQERRQPSGPRLITDPDLYDAALRCLCERPAPVPTWDSLDPLAKAYLLIRCLRTHVDSPEPRLLMLREVLQTLQDGSAEYRVRAYSTLIGQVVESECNALKSAPLNILQFRKDTFEFFKFLRFQMPEQERPVCSHLEVTGYHCTYGCFLPGAS